MKDLPIFAKIILNILLFIVYWVLLQVVIALIYWGGSYIFDYELAQQSSSFYDKLALISFLILFVLTIVFRKYFYISLETNIQEEVKQKEAKEEDGVWWI